jgi:hypothetical protein
MVEGAAHQLGMVGELHLFEHPVVCVLTALTHGFVGLKSSNGLPEALIQVKAGLAGCRRLSKAIL